MHKMNLECTRMHTTELENNTSMIAIINNNDIDIDIGYHMLDRQITHHTQPNDYQMFHG